MNIPLLRRIQAVIQQHPEQFNMASFAEDSECGTVYCIGGWAAVLASPGEPWTWYNMFGYTEGRKALNITSEQAERLFYAAAWPREFCGTAVDARQITVEQACARIDYFIATDGAM